MWRSRVMTSNDSHPRLSNEDRCREVEPMLIARIPRLLCLGDGNRSRMASLAGRVAIKVLACLNVTCEYTATDDRSDRDWLLVAVRRGTRGHMLGQLSCLRPRREGAVVRPQLQMGSLIGWYAGSSTASDIDLGGYSVVWCDSVVISSRREVLPAGPRGGAQGTRSSLVPRPSGWQPSRRAVRRSSPASTPSPKWCRVRAEPGIKMRLDRGHYHG
jgi:hypothetical protein